jgi:biotin transport system substrate-specific component
MQMLKYLSIPIAVVCLAVAAQLMIQLPEEVSVVPITGQSLAILLIIELMLWESGIAAIILYLLLGGFGLPLFADFNSGWEVLSGNAMGYFIGFFVAIAALSKWADRSKNMGAVSLRLLLATLIILFCGWLGLLKYLEPLEAFQKGILPYLPGALVKISLALILIGLYRRFKGLMKQIDGKV